MDSVGVEQGDDALGDDLSTPCNGFFDMVVADVELHAGDFQLHVMDS